MRISHRVIYYTLPSGKIPIKEFLDSLQKNQKAKIFRIFQTYEYYGLNAIIPHTKKLTGSPLWEIKLKGKDSIRVMYVVHTKTAILVLHGFLKKSQKTPIKELNTALERYIDWKRRY